MDDQVLGKGKLMFVAAKLYQDDSLTEFITSVVCQRRKSVLALVWCQYCVLEPWLGYDCLPASERFPSFVFTEPMWFSHRQHVPWCHSSKRAFSRVCHVPDTLDINHSTSQSILVGTDCMRARNTYEILTMLCVGRNHEIISTDSLWQPPPEMFIFPCIHERQSTFGRRGKMFM